MGKVFAIRCPECGHEFQQFNGVGMRGFAAGERKKDTDKFSCPSEATSSTLPQRDSGRASSAKESVPAMKRTSLKKKISSRQ